MTVYITKSYTYKIEDSIVRQAKLANKKREMENLLKKHDGKRPSKIFRNMFSEPTVWMGYKEQDTIDKNISTYSTVEDKNDNKKYSEINFDGIYKTSSGNIPIPYVTTDYGYIRT